MHWIIYQTKCIALRLLGSQYFKDSSVNTFGLLVASIVPILVTPFISRLYLPSEFGVYGLFAAFTSLVVSIGAGKYEVAITIPRERVTAFELAVAGFLVSLGFTFVSILLVIIFGNKIYPPPLAKLIWLAPPEIFMAVQFQILLNCAIRERLFTQITIARILTALISVLMMIGLGVAGTGSLGLVLAVMLSQFVGAITLFLPVARLFFQDWEEFSLSGVVNQMIRFSRFPKFALISDLANSFSLHLPMFVFSGLFGASAAGYLAMLRRLWSSSNIISRGLGETFRQKASEDFANHGKFYRTYSITFYSLLLFAVPSWILLTFTAPYLFTIILGYEWRESGVYGQILASLFCIQFIASPLGWSVYIVEKLFYNMAWQWLLLIIYAAVFLVGSRHGDARYTLLLYSISGSIMYLIYIVISWKMSIGKSFPR